jgi:hypothetical protein
MPGTVFSISSQMRYVSAQAVKDPNYSAGMSLTKISLTGIIKIFLARESLFSDILAWNGKTASLFYSAC